MDGDPDPLVRGAHGQANAPHQPMRAAARVLPEPLAVAHRGGGCHARRDRDDVYLGVMGLLSNGKVLVTGGISDAGSGFVTLLAELYDWGAPGD